MFLKSNVHLIGTKLKLKKQAITERKIKHG